MADVKAVPRSSKELVQSLSEFFQTERGIRPEILSAFGVTFTDANTAILPYPNGEKTRKHLPDGTRRFYFTEGKRPWLYKGPNESGITPKVVFLVEGETDTMRLWQELMNEQVDHRCDVVGLSGINCWRPEMVDDPIIQGADKVLVILDNDVDYTVAARVDQTWRDMKKDMKGKAQRIKLPSGVKDLCEFFKGYDLDALRALTVRQPSSVSRYRPLDLTLEPPPTDWLLEGLVAQGDVTLLLGDGGLGKSWLTKGLAVAVAEGWTSYLDRLLGHSGRVLYADEENPEDVVRGRLKKLGLTPQGQRNLRFLSNEGIRLDRRPEDFLEEAIDYDPQLIVLDSMTRIHTEDENNAGAMSKLYNDGIKPLARETGAAVVLIHHTNKAGGARGSSDVVNFTDAGIGVSAADGQPEGTLRVKVFRSRRRASGEAFTVRITDQDDGSVALIPGKAPDPPF